MVHVSFTSVTGVRFQLSCSYLVKVTFVICETSVVQFDFIKNHRFSPGTPVSSCSDTGPMRGGPYWTSRKNSSESRLGYPG